MAAYSEHKESVLVTAASGFIAGHIVKQLLEAGFNVRGTVRSLKDAETKYKYLYELQSNKLELIECDLKSPANWDKAVSNCTYIIHTANPMPDTKTNAKMTKNEFTDVTVNGMKHILNACLKTGTIKRFVYTSSRQAMMNAKQFNDPNEKLIIYGNSKQFTDSNKMGENEYAKSKVLTEQFAWNWLKKNNFPFEMCCINPSIVIGPLLNKRVPGSMTVITRLLNGEMPFLVKSQQLMSDVRDVARAHISALKAQNVNGKRYLLANNQSLWIKDIAMVLLNESSVKEYHSNIPKMEAFTFLVKFMAMFDNTIKIFILPRLNRLQCGYNQASVRDLNVVYRPINESIIDAAESLVKFGCIKKPKKRYLRYVVVGLGIVSAVGYYYFVTK